MLIDLESLFHSQIQFNKTWQSAAEELAESVLNDSVYAVGLLPQTLYNPKGNKSSKGVDVSGSVLLEIKYRHLKALSLQIA